MCQLLYSYVYDYSVWTVDYLPKEILNWHYLIKQHLTPLLLKAMAFLSRENGKHNSLPNIVTPFYFYIFAKNQSTDFVLALSQILRRWFSLNLGAPVCLCSMCEGFWRSRCALLGSGFFSHLVWTRARPPRGRRKASFPGGSCRDGWQGRGAVPSGEASPSAGRWVRNQPPSSVGRKVCATSLLTSASLPVTVAAKKELPVCGGGSQDGAFWAWMLGVHRPPSMWTD